MRYLIYIAFQFLFIASLFGQGDPRFYGFPNNHIDWKTIESDFFYVHYQEGAERSALVVSRIAEEIHPPISELYEYVPDQKVSIILRDREDYANGAAYFFDNKIEIWVPSLDTPLRGTNNWLRNVITHEYTHIVQIRTAIKGKKNRPALYLQWLSYEDVRRPDVLYGFPNGIATYPFASLNMPAWLAEGTAQYMRDGIHYENWDAHRDMILRTRAVEGKILPLAFMGSFDAKTSLERETVYNHGYALTRYLARRYGEDSLRALTKGLAKKGVYSVEKAMKNVFGIDGVDLHAQWKSEMESHYVSQRDIFKPDTYKSLEEEGFFNFYPTFKKDGTILYLSNRGRDFSWTKLVSSDSVVIKDFTQNSAHVHLPGTDFSCALHENELPDRVGDAFTLSPDEKFLAFGRTTINKAGEYYKDLYIYSFETGKSERMTKSARFDQPSWHPKDSVIVGVQNDAGTQNLVLYHMASDSMEVISNFEYGEQIFRPIWSVGGDSLFFSKSRQGNRDLYVMTVNNREISPLFVSEKVDYRHGFPSPDGKYLFFSADSGGIYNIYRQELGEKKNPQRITNSLGGAFMPSVDDSGNIVFSEYKWDGYKISYIPAKEVKIYDKLQYQQPESIQKSGDIPTEWEKLASFDDSDVTTFIPTLSAIHNRDTTVISLETYGSSDERKVHAYEDKFTKFNFFPIIRFDNYTKLNGNNGALLKAGQFGEFGGNLWRDGKVGFLFASREVRERLNVFGGVLMGPGSYESANGFRSFANPERISKLDRDIFLIMEYTGLPFIKRHWSPTISVELYNLRRNVLNGFQVEDFKSTASLPDTVGVDIAYDIWQGDVFLRSKLDLYSMIELGFSYSPFTVETEPFYLQEFRQVVPSSSSRYFIGRNFSAAHIYRYDLPDRNSDVVPFGLRGFTRYSYQPAELLDEYQIKDGLLLPVYAKEQNHSLEANIRWTTKTKLLPIGLRARAFTFLNSPDDYFYLDYIGGFIGMRSYPFFSIGGNTTVFAEASTFFPILPKIEKQFGRTTFHKLWAKVYAEVGNGWGGPLEIGNNMKSGVGAELRLSMSSYYLFPSKFFVNASYGFDEINLRLPEEFISTAGSNSATYGRELLFYFGLLFEFDL